MPERPQSDAGDRQDQGPHGQADRIGQMSVEDERIRWHCRRGLLELDLVLSKFLDKRYPYLSSSQKSVFVILLAYADNDLWDLLSGRTVVSNPEIKKFIELFE
ncbi:MAG TPA: succinate dehydrogenase assembly factor 2 [Burkholderiales bacterium]|nr:succinate dehydrogenase assembly factor 2 [Burkholderiales bacterium]